MRYQIRIGGRLGRTMRAAFPDLHTHAQGPDTVLTGNLPDQAALHGVLTRIEALGLELLEVRRESPAHPEGPRNDYRHPRPGHPRYH